MPIDLDTLYLAKGGHNRREQGMCLLEAVAYFAGREHTDAPPCVSPVLRSYGMSINDHWLIRTYTPAWLDLAGLTAEAQALRDLRRIVDLVAAQEAGPVVRAGQVKAAAARDAAWDAAWAALKPTVDQLQDSAIELFARMANPAANS